MYCNKTPCTIRCHVCGSVGERSSGILCTVCITRDERREERRARRAEDRHLVPSLEKPWFSFFLFPLPFSLFFPLILLLLGMGSALISHLIASIVAWPALFLYCMYCMYVLYVCTYIACNTCVRGRRSGRRFFYILCRKQSTVECVCIKCKRKKQYPHPSRHFSFSFLFSSPFPLTKHPGQSIRLSR